MAEGVKESRRKRTPPCNGADRVRECGIPNPKRCRLPAGLSGSEALLPYFVVGEVRRCLSSNRPTNVN